MTGDRDLFGEVRATARRAVRFGRRLHLPAALRAKAELMRREGAPVKAIAEALGISEAAAWNRLKVEFERAMPGGRRPGRPQWAPSSADREMVERLASEGATTAQVAVVLGITEPTIRRHCRADLARGRARRTGDAGRSPVGGADG